MSNNKQFDDLLADEFKGYFNNGFWLGFVTGVLFTSAVCGVRCYTKYR